MRAADLRLAAALVALAGCTGDHYTSVLLRVSFDDTLALDQLRISALHDGAPLFPPALRPEVPRPLTGPQTVAVLLDDALADAPQPAVALEVTGLRGAVEVAWGTVTATVQRSREVDAVLTIGGQAMPGSDAGLVAIASPSLPPGRLQQPYLVSLQVVGGVAPYRWSVVAGAIPAGLQLASDSGILSGTPTVAGTFPVTLAVTDSATPAQSDKRPFDLVIIDPHLVVQTAMLPPAALGVAYSAMLEASGGTQPYVWNLVAGTLPPPLTLSAAGTLSGKPNRAGSYSFTVGVRDDAGATADKALSLSIH